MSVLRHEDEVRTSISSMVRDIIIEIIDSRFLDSMRHDAVEGISLPTPGVAPTIKLSDVRKRRFHIVDNKVVIITNPS